MGTDIVMQDVNKCQTLMQRQVHYESVDYIGAYVDYTVNNVYYTVSKA